MSHPALAELQWKKFPVLDDGFVCLVDVMGDDAAVVQAARVSYGAGTRKVSDDRGLIRYLMRHRHTTPFEMAELKFLVRVPMDCWRQWVRHRTACLVGETTLHLAGVGRALEPVEEGTPAELNSPGETVCTIGEFCTAWEAGRFGGRRRAPAAAAVGASGKGSSFDGADPSDSVQTADEAVWIWSCDEATGRMRPTRVVDVWRSGVKPVYRLRFAHGAEISASADHRFLTEAGWKTLREAVGGLPEVGAAEVDASAPRFAGVGSAEAAERVWSRAVSVELLGARPTFDLEVAGPDHNFLAAGMVVHNSINEYSTRYSLAIDAQQKTPSDAWRTQSTGNRQGSEGRLEPSLGGEFTLAEEKLLDSVRAEYQRRIEAGIAREQARKDLPLSTYTEAYWKIDLHNLLHFLALRMDAHAQSEIRDYATTVGREIVQKMFPLVWEAFEDYRLQSMELTRLDADVIRRLQARLVSLGRSAAAEEDFLAVQDPTWEGLARSRERDECRAKLVRLGLLPEAAAE